MAQKKFSNVPDHLQGKMERCVQKVKKDGKTKTQAIRICFRSVVGKEITVDEAEDILKEVDAGNSDSDTKEGAPEKDDKGGFMDRDGRWHYIPSHITTFDELDDLMSAEKAAKGVREVIHQFLALSTHTLLPIEPNAEIVRQKAAHVVELAEELTRRLPEAMRVDMDEKEIDWGLVIKDEGSEVPNQLFEGIKSVIRNTLGGGSQKEKDPEPRYPETSLTFWHNKETGRMEWMATYSNNFLDNDRPPEIIAAQSHHHFAKAVEKGEAPMPELWHWHVPEWKYGEATYLTVDEPQKGVVFAVAGGLIDKGKEWFAEWVSEQKDTALSHGMLPDSITRDPEKPNIILTHISKEISTLQLDKAANKLTDNGFVLLKEAEMTIPAHKRQELLENGVPEDKLEELEASNQRKAQKASEAGLEHKEESQEEEAATQTEPDTSAASDEEPAANVEETDETPDETKEEEEEAGDEDAPVTRKEIVGALAEVINPMIERIEGVEKSVAALQEEDEEKIGEKAADAPQASLAAMLAKSIIGSDETRVDGRSTLGRSAPEETEVKADTPASSIPFVQSILSGKRDGNRNGGDE